VSDVDDSSDMDDLDMDELRSHMAQYMHLHASRMGGVLFELFVKFGWDGHDIDEDTVSGEQLMGMDLSDREAVLDALVRSEFPEDGRNGKRPETAPKWLRDLVDDWLYDPHGRGATSGLPMTGF
jgi:hypothetical protein